MDSGRDMLEGQGKNPRDRPEQFSGYLKRPLAISITFSKPPTLKSSTGWSKESGDLMMCPSGGNLTASNLTLGPFFPPARRRSKQVRTSSAISHTCVPSRVISRLKAERA